MTATPEDRAKAVMVWLRQECSDAICTYLDCPSCGCMAHLAQAIRDAEDAALERAAHEAAFAHLGMAVFFVSQSDCEQFNRGVQAAAAAITALKHSKETQA